ncbi:MAG: competence protein CelA, partial [uncultured bacterium]
SQKIYVPFEWEIEFKSDNSIELLKDDIMDYEEAVDFISRETTPSYSEDTSVQYNSLLINVNSATEAELDTLAGIGKAYAQKIITNRPYATFQELKSKSGIPISVLEKIKSSITY